MANSISDYLHDYKVRVFDNLPVPQLSAVAEGTSGSTEYEYKATFLTLVGESLPSAIATVSNGNATLNGFNKNKLSTLEIPQAATKVRYWKNAWTYYSQTIRENSTGYDLGNYMVLSTNSLVRYQCTTAGTSASSDPGTWPTTLGDTKTDGTVTWTAVTNKNDNWVLLGEVDPDPGQLYDTGQSTTVATLPTTDTSGRPGVIAILPKPGTMIQRAERIDTMSLISQMVQDGFDLIHKSGDVISGCSEYQIDGNLWGFNSGKIYFLGRFIDVPAGQITLTGSGEEKVGVVIEPLYETPDDDHVWRCGEDEGVAGEYANTGPDVLYFQFTWVKDNDAQVTIKEFVDGVPKSVTLSPERTELDRRIAYSIHGLAGHYCVENFPLQVVDHPTDDDQLLLKIGAGRAAVNGFDVKSVGTRTVAFNKARETESENNSGLDVFSIPGGVNSWTHWQAGTVYAEGDIVVPGDINGYRYKVTARAGDFESGQDEPTWSETPGETITDNDLTWTVLGDDYDLDGLALTVQVGSGNEHTLTFAADDLTAAQVVAAIEAEFNAYPTDGDLVDAVNAEAIVQLRAIPGKSLTISGTALAQLGWASGTTTPEGTRIYRVNDAYVKTVTDMNYKVATVSQVSHNGTTHKDLLPNDNVVSILGASTSAADAHDGKWDYLLDVDFVKDGNYISFAGLGGAEPGSGSTFYVAYEYNKNAVKGSRHLCRVVDAKVVKTGEDLPDNLTFTDATSITRISTGASVTPTGTPKDVVSILRVNNSPGQSTDQYTSYSLVKNSGALTHETSYIDWSEAGTPGTTGSGQPSNAATYYVTYEFWYHATEGDYVAADSYDSYPDIEMAPNGTWYLRDCIDFRTDAGTWPIHGEDPTFDYEFYLARVDKLVITDAVDFLLVSGAPAISPPTPQDQSGTLSLAVMRIAPYTYSASDVAVVSVEPLRLSQKRLQRLVEEVDLLKYQTVLNNLENEVANVPVVADKQGLFSDALVGYTKMDLTFNRGGVRHTAALDRVGRRLLLPASNDMKVIEVDLPNSTHVRRAGNSIMLDYQPAVLIDQPKAGIYVNGATDYVVTDYLGLMEVTPTVDVFVDTEQLPALNVDFDNNLGALMDAISAQSDVTFSTLEWDPIRVFTTSGVLADEGIQSYVGGLIDELDWSSGWLGNLGGSGRAWYATRSGLQTSINPGKIEQDMGDRVVDMSLVQYMRTKDENGNPFYVQLMIRDLMPNADHACTINGISVDLTYDDSVDSPFGSAGSATYDSKTTAKTDNDGKLTAKFIMPEGVQVGKPLIKVFWHSDEDASKALGNIYSAGFMQSTQSTTLGMEAIEQRVETVTDGPGTRVEFLWDPLAQTFFPKERVRYISEIGLFFATKSDTHGYTVEIRETSNGYPTQKVLASSHLPSESINVSSDGSLETRFVFSNVQGYSPDNEYCFVGLPGLNSTDYNLCCSELGTVDFITGERILSQSHEGVLFHSPNNSTWEPWTKRDLKFKIYESNFENSAQLVWKNITGVEASLLVLAAEEFIAPGTNVKWAYSTNGGVSWKAFNPKIQTDLGSVITQIMLRVDITSLGGSYAVVDRFAGIVLLLHDLEANAVFNDQYFTDPLYYPNKVTATMQIDADGVNGVGTRTITPMFSFDDGVTWVEIGQKEGDTPVAQQDPYYTYTFETPDEATITGATNASPIVVTSAGHGFKDNAMVVIASVGGNTNANGTWRVTNATTDTFELYTDAGVVSSGNGAYTTGGTINMAEFSQIRPRIYFATTNKAVTPSVKNVGFIASRA